MRKNLLVLGLMVALTGLATQASAAVITYTTPAGATTSGGPVDASATFTTGPGQLTIVLQDLLANPTDVAQVLSDLYFTLSGDLTSGTLTSSSGQERTVNADGTFTDGAVVSTGWLLTSGATFHLDDLNGGAGPAHTIIGPPDGGGLYSNANGSIAGNGPHNPFLNQTATFVLNIPGMTANTSVTSATFSFGTISGIDVSGGGAGSTIPEPATMLLFGLGMIGGARRFARSRRS